jgi:flavin-dependent dehydrogenase
VSNTNLSDTNLFDVVILGGGPAATALALTLRHYSRLTVAIIEKSDYDTPRIGETLSPGVQTLLSYLKVWEAFLADQHQQSFGTSGAWGSSELQTRDFIFTPYGTGWHLDRQRFDRMLAEAVISSGGTVLCQAQLVSYQRLPHDGWQLKVKHAGQQREIRARFVVDASGKTASFAKKEGHYRWMMDRLIAAVGIFHFSESVPQDTFTLVETEELGWWYSAKLPDGQMIVALMTDADLGQQQDLTTRSVWLSKLAQTVHTRQRLEGGELVTAVKVHAAHSSYLMKPFGAGWLAVGDAAVAYDPLSASGIPRALDSGIWAARAIYDLLQHQDSTALELYAAKIKQTFDLYYTTKTRYYQMEQRWPHSLFWQRRQQVVDLDPQKVVHCPSAERSWESMDLDLTPREYQLLCKLSFQPTPAYQVVANFQQQSRRQIPDQRVILALQNLVNQGVIKSVAAI